MAAVLDFNLICKGFIDLKHVLQEPEIDKLGIIVEKIFSIDNWGWENKKNLQNISNIDKALEKARIVVIHLKSHAVKDIGIYIEKIKEEYVYNLWINTEGYPEFDADKIEQGNEYFFYKFFQIFEEIERKQNIGFRILGVGVETNFQYAEENISVIEKSENMIAWVMNKNLDGNMVLADYRKKEIEGMNLIIYER